jgi:hypothetical protein
MGGHLNAMTVVCVLGFGQRRSSLPTASTCPPSLHIGPDLALTQSDGGYAIIPPVDSRHRDPATVCRERVAQLHELHPGYECVRRMHHISRGRDSPPGKTPLALACVRRDATRVQSDNPGVRRM